MNDSSRIWTAQMRKRNLNAFLSNCRFVHLSQVQETKTQEKDVEQGASSCSSENAGARRSEVKGADVLSSEALQLLMQCAARPCEFVMAHYEALGCPMRVARRSLVDLEARGLVRVHSLVRKGRGARPKVVEVLAAGGAELASRGLPGPASSGGRGGFRHWVYSRLLGKSRWFAGTQVSYEAKFGGKVSDVLGRSPDGKVTAGEVILSGSLSWNEAQLRKALDVEGVHELIIACDDQKVLSRLRARLEVGEEFESLFRVRGNRLTFVFLGEATSGEVVS